MGSTNIIKNILNPFAHYKEREEEKQLENILNQKQRTKTINTRRLSNLRQTYKKQMKNIQYLDLHALKSHRRRKCCLC